MTVVYAIENDEFYYLDEHTTWGLDPNKIQKVYFTQNQTLTSLVRLTYKDYLARYAGLTTKSRPAYFCIKDKKLYIAPKPDQDYELKVVHYNKIDRPIVEDDTFSQIDDKKTLPIFYYIQSKMSDILDSNNTVLIEKNRATALSTLRDTEVDTLNREHMRSNISWF